jgi:hypothetical protein
MYFYSYLIQTSSPVYIFCAVYTTPKPPLPISLIILYFPAISSDPAPLNPIELKDEVKGYIW